MVLYRLSKKKNGSITWKVSIPVIHMDITIWMTTAWGMHRSGSWKAIHWSGLIILSFWMQREMVARDYLATEKGNYLMDFDGNKVGEGKAELESFFSDDYVVTVSADEGTEVDLKDKLALCIRLSNDFMSDYSD